MHGAELEQAGARWMASMLRGDLEAAWNETDRMENGRRAGGNPVGPANLVWDGTPFHGRRVVIRAQNGLGDTLQFARFVPRVVAAARSVRFLVQPELMPLLTAHGGLGSIGNLWCDFRERGEVEIESMELAYALRASQRDISAGVPWLPAWVARDRRRPRVGLIWSASRRGAARSLHPSDLPRLLANRSVTFFNLTQDAAAPKGLGWIDLAPRTGEVCAAVDVLRTLDLLISVDTFGAHLAGSMGCPVWLLLRREADWRWGGAEGRTFWYPGMRLFRQKVEGDWTPVLEEVARGLDRREYRDFAPDRF